MTSRASLLLLTANSLLHLAAAASEGCHASSNNTFEFSIDVFSSEWGAYEVEGCEGTSPTLHIVRGVEYTFVQSHESNWMHPLGLAYYPDGAHGYLNHASVPELEHPTPSECDDAKYMCNPGAVNQAPLYCVNNVCENYDDWNNGITSGLDVYEPMFKIPRDQWIEKGGDGKYAVKLTIPVESKTSQLFYFCHIHKYMSGMIIVESAGNSDATNELKLPFEPIEYYSEVSSFDSRCGTFGISNYSGDGLASYCPHDNFLCKPKNDAFSSCMQALDCKMDHEMRVHESENPIATFMLQMIPHHQNAVNMAKTLLKFGQTSVGWDDEDADVEGLLMDIIAGQNMQIQSMQAWLDTHAADSPTTPCASPAVQSSTQEGAPSNTATAISCAVSFLMASLLATSFLT